MNALSLVRKTTTNTVWEVLEAKGHDVQSVSSAVSVFEAIKRMSERDVGALTHV